MISDEQWNELGKPGSRWILEAVGDGVLFYGDSTLGRIITSQGYFGRYNVEFVLSGTGHRQTLFKDWDVTLRPVAKREIL